MNITYLTQDLPRGAQKTLRDGELTPCNGTIRHPNWKVLVYTIQMHKIYIYSGQIITTSTEVTFLWWFSKGSVPKRRHLYMKFYENQHGPTWVGNLLLLQKGHPNLTLVGTLFGSAPW